MQKRWLLRLTGWLLSFLSADQLLTEHSDGERGRGLVRVAYAVALLYTLPRSRQLRSSSCYIREGPPV